MVNQMIRIPEECVLWLDLTEDTGNIVYDRSGHGNNGTVYGARLDKSKPLIGRFFDGNDDRIRVKHSDTLDITDEITLMAWIYRKGQKTTYSDVIRKQLAYILFWTVSNEAACYIAQGGAWVKFLFSKTPDWFNNKWHFVAFTYDSSKARLYIDGTLDKEYNNTGSIDSSTNDIYIGAGETSYGVSEFFYGYIAHVSIYNRALEPKEIKRLYEDFQKRVFRRIAPLDVRMR